METEQFGIWKDIKISFDLIGETVKSGEGAWEKEYTYIKIPTGYGYDNYCFLLSGKCVHFSPKENNWWFSICFDMKIELIFDPELRKEGQRYKRYKMSGAELFENVFKDYEVNFKKEYEERTAREESKKIKRDKSIRGKVVYGLYTGNRYENLDSEYTRELTCKAYFTGHKQTTYCNSKFDRVSNVDVNFIVFEDMSRYEFLRFEKIINDYLSDYSLYEVISNSLEQRLKWKEDSRKGLLPKG